MNIFQVLKLSHSFFIFKSLQSHLCVCLSQITGRSVAHLSQRDALRILAASQHPITVQIKGQRGRSTEVDRGTWEPLPLNLQHLNLPHSVIGPELNATSPSFQDR